MFGNDECQPRNVNLWNRRRRDDVYDAKNAKGCIYDAGEIINRTAKGWIYDARDITSFTAKINIYDARGIVARVAKMEHDN